MLASDIVRFAAPSAHSCYIQGYADGAAVLEAGGITTPLRLVHYMAFVLACTDGLTAPPTPATLEAQYGVHGAEPKDLVADYGSRMGLDLLATPDVLLLPSHVLRPSLLAWEDRNGNTFADCDDGLSIARGGVEDGSIGRIMPPQWPAQDLWIAKLKGLSRSVPAVQRQLVNNGHEIEVSGFLCAGTRAAILDFQANAGLVVDGLVGAKTSAALGIAKFT